MKTSNYIARLPQEATIKSMEHLPDYDLITIHLPALRERKEDIALLSIDEMAHSLPGAGVLDDTVIRAAMRTESLFG